MANKPQISLYRKFSNGTFEEVVPETVTPAVSEINGARTLDEIIEELAASRGMLSKSDSLPLMDGTASAGSQSAYAAGDHRHPIDTTRAAVTYVETELAKKQNTLMAGTNISISGNTISAGTRIVYISDFETFNPSSSLIDSATNKAFALNQGESCQFYANHNANGKPWMGYKDPLTGIITNNDISAIYYWSGTITRIYSSYYMVTAYGANTTNGRPQMATRVYYGSSRYDWVISSDYSSRSTSGYLKMPSGIMIQWGALSNSTSGVQYNTIQFPISFSGVPYFVTGCLNVNASVTAAEVVQYGSLNASNMTVGRRAAQANSVGYSGQNLLWVAIGTWK